MNKIANVVFAYSPKNDDELELTVGDKIEVIGFEEEGWWKGKLRGRIGVFPSNFVEVIEAESPQISQNTNKLNSIFGTKVSTKNSLSSNSLNAINNNSTNNLNPNNSINNSNNNLIMNNTHQQHETDSSNDYPFVSADGYTSSTNSLSERRPNPLRGIGYGDIFAAGAKTKPLPADPTTGKPTTAMASERLSTASLSTLQKPIPKKPPPPAPTDSTLQKPIPKKPPPPAPTDGTNGSASDQAPALPPKPSNQFSPFLQHRYLPAAPTAQRRTEQARVIYAYIPTNDDEIEMEVGDIINIIDKNIEDAGWWKGELNGKVGVFPDNFVELIELSDIVNQDWNGSSRLSGGTCNSNHSNNTSNSGGSSQPQQPVVTEGKMKSVFAGTPKGFSKELESNLEKHSNPASFLSLKRNKLQQQMPTGSAGDSGPMSSSNIEPVTSTPTSNAPITTTMMTSDTNDKHNGHTISSIESSPGKLNHITANRAKGPSRRPPSNILNKRNQFSELANNHKHEPVEIKEELPPISLPVFNPITPIQPQVNDCSPISLPPEQNQLVASTHIAPTGSSQFELPKANDVSSPTSMKTSSPASNTISENQLVTPKSSQRTIQSAGQQPDNKSKLSSSSPPSRPPWMVELRKTNAEKKRDPLPASTASMIEESFATSTPTVPTTTIAATTATVTTPAISISTTVTATTTTSTTAASATTTSPVATTTTTTASNSSIDNMSVKHDNILKQISKNVTNEIIELKNEVRKLREDFKGIGELKEAIETMKNELRTCQSATESQRRYIKELVNNLADERKKIAAMQVEIDRNLK